MKRKRKRVNWYEWKNQAEEGDTVAEINIFGPIGGGFFADPDAPTGKRVAQELEELPESVETIRVFINSPGGSVFDGIHIANALKRQHDEYGRDVVVEIEALAASAATIISSAGSTIRMPKNALMMVHNPWALAIGESKDMRDLADLLDKVRNQIIASYRWVSKKTTKALGALMDATTWMEADEALEHGFITEVAGSVKAAAALEALLLSHLEDEIPEEYRERVLALFAEEQEEEDDEAAAEEPADDADHDDAEPESDEPSEAELEDDDDDQGADASVENSEVEMTEQEKKELKAAAAKAERERISGIGMAIAGGIAGGLAKADMEALQKKAVDENMSVDAVGLEILNSLADAPANTDGPAEGPSGVGATLVEDEHDKRRAGITGALLTRAAAAGNAVRQAQKKNPDHPAFKDVDLDGGEFRGMTLAEMIRADMERIRSGSTRGVPTRNLLEQFVKVMGSANYQTTSDFAVALENAMHKTLLASFSITPDTWSEICAIGEVSDFRAHPRYRTGYIASLDQIYEHGEYTNKTVPDAAKEAITALTYGNIVGLSREAIINDDMGVFNRVAMQVGRAAALTIETGFYSLLAQNSGLGPAMNDTNPLFDAAHNNLGAGTALDAAAIDANAQIMEAQQDLNSQEYLDLRPAILLVPRGLRATAITINESQFDPDTADSNKPNYVLGLFDKVIATNRLSGTRRYLFADPMDVPCIEVAFLNGEREPYLEMRDGWRSDGVEWKVRHDFGIAAIEWRSAVTDAGAS